MSSTPRTLLEKIWDAHLVCAPEGEQPLIYIDRHLVHEVTSAQAFEGLRLAGRRVRRPEATFATPDHNIPTTDRRLPIADVISRQQIDTLRNNCREFGVRLFDLGDADQGIVHVIGPELGITQPGMTIVCGDSHTATHGALGALAFGIGTSEVEHVLATQTLRQSKPKSFEVRVEGSLHPGITAKDLVLYIIGQLSTEGGTGYVIEYTGPCIRALGMEERMTVCNMSIEAGARAGMIAPIKSRLITCAAAITPRAISRRPWRPGRNFPPIPAPGLTAPRSIRVAMWCRRSLGAPIRRRWWGSMQPCPIRPRLPMPASGIRAAGRWNTWASPAVLASAISRSTESSSAPAPTAGSRISGPLPRWYRGIQLPRISTPWWCRAVAA